MNEKAWNGHKRDACGSGGGSNKDKFYFEITKFVYGDLLSKLHS
jgi:hypothetical protein